MTIKERIETYRLIAVVRQLPPDKAVAVAQALYDGGIRLIEVTYNHKNPDTLRDTPAAVAALCDAFGDRMGVGAGTVLDARQAREAAAAGAQYIVSPGFSAAVVEETKARGRLAVPGALTPTEIAEAYAAGADYVKIFPAGVLGIAYLKAVMAPLGHIPLMVTGSVNERNLTDFLNLGVIAAGVGGNMVSPALIGRGDWAAVTAAARQYTAQIPVERG